MSAPDIDVAFDMDPEAENHLYVLRFATTLSQEQYDELVWWMNRIEEATCFTTDDALDACAVLVRLDLEPDVVIESLGPVAAYAHANDRPIEAVAEQIGMVMTLSDLEADDLPGLLDLSESLCEEVAE